MSEEKTEQGTDQKRKEAGRRGQVLKSAELQQAVTMAFALLVLLMTARWVTSLLLSHIRSSLDMVSRGDAFDPTKTVWLEDLLVLAFKAFMPILLVSGLVGALVALFLSKGQLKTNLLPEDLQKFNIVKNAGRWFSKNTLAELVRLCLKVGFLLHICRKTFEEMGPTIFSVRLTQLHQGVTMAEAMQTLIGRFLALAIFIGVLDLAYQRWDYLKNLMMSKHEVKEEHKRSEGDPMTKGRRRSFGRRLIKKAGMNRLPEASVVITNPTHYAVALKYDASMAAPQIICKGCDHLALEIRRRANELEIPIVEDKPLARALFKFDIETTIPEELFEAAARVLLSVRDAERYF